mmetsp:Transcript_1332/g.2657  ORF Transcript_1332/g.2657 Transcript_1332/m.2657 type:complete len:168 (-) Transcript_1332:58-561(-)
MYTPHLRGREGVSMSRGRSGACHTHSIPMFSPSSADALKSSPHITVAAPSRSRQEGEICRFVSELVLESSCSERSHPCTTVQFPQHTHTPRPHGTAAIPSRARSRAVPENHITCAIPYTLITRAITCNLITCAITCKLVTCAIKCNLITCAITCNLITRAILTPHVL